MKKMIVSINKIPIQFYIENSDQIFQTSNIQLIFQILKNENINDEKYIPLLKTFSKYQIKLLYHNEIIKYPQN